MVEASNGHHGRGKERVQLALSYLNDKLAELGLPGKAKAILTFANNGRIACFGESLSKLVISQILEGPLAWRCCYPNGQRLESWDNGEFVLDPRCSHPREDASWVALVGVSVSRNSGLIRRSFGK
jgi:hypothetical protein